MEHLKLAWFYRFWIVVGVVALMPIVGYFVDTAKVARSAEQRKRDLETTKSGLQTNIKTGRFPNERWVTGVNEKKDVLDQQVNGAWIDLYKRQEVIRTFPKEVEATFLEAGPKGLGKQLTAQDFLQYQSLFRGQFVEIVRSLDIVGERNSKGLVQMNPGLLDQFLTPWSDPNYRSPTTVTEAWLAQENVWIVRAMMGVVRRANEGAENWAKAPVKRIFAIKIGPGAQDFSADSKVKPAVWSGPDDIIDPENMPKDAQGNPAKSAVRYLDKTKLYKPVPIYMELHVNQGDLLKILAQFGNSEVPMEIKQVEVAQQSEAAPVAVMKSGPAAKDKEAADEVGEVIRKNDEYFQLTDLRVYARAYLYLKPPKLEEEEKAAKAKAAAGAPATPPATTGS